MPINVTQKGWQINVQLSGKASERTPDLATAWHEGAHAVIALALKGRTSMAVATTGGGVCLHSGLDAQGSAIVAAAGGIAERWAIGSGQTSTKDAALIAAAPDTDAAKRTACQLLRKNWGKVKALADALMVTPIMRGDRIREIIERAAPATCQPVAEASPVPTTKRFKRDEQGEIAVVEEWKGGHHLRTSTIHRNANGDMIEVVTTEANG